MGLEYEQILSRLSIRRYQPLSLETSLLVKVKELITKVEGLNLSNVFSCEIFDYHSGERTAGALGAFGRIFQAPYFFAPHLLGEIGSLVDLGFRTQQIVLDLWSVGIGSCYIGCVHQQKRVIDLLDLPDNARIVSTVAFGVPSEDQSKYFYQKISQAITKSKKWLENEELFLADSYREFGEISETTKKIIEAGRQAPSATNAQPWRFNIADGYFEIFAKRKSVSKIYDLSQEYTLHDAGICMANMSRAALSLGQQIEWEILPISHVLSPEGLIKIARYKIT